MLYTPFYIKTNYTLLSSMIKIDDLIELAKSLEIKTLAIADNNLYGAMEFYQKCKKAGIKPIIGLELIIDDKPIILYAKGHLGYKNICKLATLNSTQTITVLDLKNHTADILAILPNSSRELFDEYNNLFENLFIGYESKEELATVSDKPAVYLKEILYLDRDDKGYISYLYAIRDGVLETSIEPNYTDSSLTGALAEFTSINYENDSTNEIVNLCQLQLNFNESLLPKYPTPDDLNSHTYLKRLCKEGLKNRFGEIVERRYVDRLKEELDVIDKMGFSDYFLIVWDYVKYAKESGILVGPGRGSAAGSLVSYCLAITDVDPLKYNLLFERFLNLERTTMPDIDIDFEDERREEVINYCISKYGLKRVAPIITFGTLTTKQAIRDVGRVMNMDLKTIDYLSKLLDSKLTLSENLKQNERLQKYIKNDKELTKLYKIALKFEGLKRHTSTHAAGIVMSNIDLDEVIPLDYRDDFYLSGYSMEYLEEIGLLKMDFLAIRTLTTIQKIISSINNQLNLNLSFDKIPLNDEKTILMFNNANTMGIFQFESTGMLHFLQKYKPSNLEDIFATIALFRPGPMKNIDLYINRKNGRERVDYFHEDLEGILKPTYGIIVYQEQIMQISNTLAGYSLGEADILRRAMSKKDETKLKENRNQFIRRSVERGYNEEMINKVYDLIMRFAEYGFPRAHAVSYSLIAYKMAYLKANFPEHFLKTLLTMNISSEIKIKEYIHEAKLNGIKILGPNINLSGREYLVKNRQILFPLSGIKNLNSLVVQNIITERLNGDFKDIFDFVNRLYNKSINRKVLESLINAGSFLEFGYNKRTLIENLDLIINYGEISQNLGELISLKPNITILDEYDKNELFKKELEVFGFYLTTHPVSDYKIKHNLEISISNVHLYFNRTINIVVLVDRIREITTKTGKKMCFLTVSDELDSIEAIIFPNLYENNNNIQIDKLIMLNARVEKRDDQYQLIVNSFRNI